MHSRVPESFMKGIFISPHSFSDPQNPQHGKYVDMQLKNDLYYSILNQITNVQFTIFNWKSFVPSILKTQNQQDQEWLQIEQIKPCLQSHLKQTQQNSFQNSIEQYKQYRGKVPNSQKYKVDIISCQDWKVRFHNGSQQFLSQYRVKVLQTQTDIFRSQIYPPTFWKKLKDLLVN